MPETYAAAMQPEVDWGVGNPMNEFRNRRTDVTPQFLYQYGLHFKLPKDWNPEVGIRITQLVITDVLSHISEVCLCTGASAQKGASNRQVDAIRTEPFLGGPHPAVRADVMCMLITYVMLHLQDPQERMKRFRSYLWIGHMQHARCYETSLNFWRRLRSHAT
jgi:hypothetical protein